MRALFTAVVLLCGLATTPAFAAGESVLGMSANPATDIIGLDNYPSWDNEENTLFQHPPGSTWITIRCFDRRGNRRVACYAPAGFKIRHLRLRRESNRCRGTQDWTWDQNGVYVRRGCRVVVRAFIIPEQYCKDANKYRFCR